MNEKEIEKQVIKKKCDYCNTDDCEGCESYFDKCPNCSESLSNDLDWEFNYCPNCGQKLKY